MPDHPARLVTVGAGQAAVSAVRLLRRRGLDGRIVVLSDEGALPYQRPPLSKEYLRGDADLDDVTILDEAWCAAHDVELRRGVVAEAVDTAARRVRLRGGEEIHAENVLLATGARPRRLPGVEGERVVYLRGLADADRLRALLAGAARVAVVGAGLVGSEVAASARELGLAVTCLEADELPMAGRLGDRMARAYAEMHRARGVDLRCGQRISSVAQAACGVVVGTESRTGARETVEADLLVVAVGAEPVDEIARASGLAVDARGGVVVDEACRAAAEGVFAAGDVAARRDPASGAAVRVEHVDNATAQGAVVARAVLGRPATGPGEVPWFGSDQYDHSLQFVGHPAPGADVVVRGSVPDHDFTAFYVTDGRVRAAFAVDRGGDVPAARQLVALGVPVRTESLADEDVDLFDLADAADTVSA